MALPPSPAPISPSSAPGTILCASTRTKYAKYVKNGFDIKGLVTEKCPTKALAWDDKEPKLNLQACGLRALHALHQQDAQGAETRGGQRRDHPDRRQGPIIKGAYLSWVLVPFMKMEPPYDEAKDLLRKIWEWWDENGRSRERVAELIERMGLKTFLRAVDIKPVPQMVYQTERKSIRILRYKITFKERKWNGKKRYRTAEL